MKNFIIFTPHPIHFGDKMKADEMEVSYDIHGRGQKCIQNVWETSEGKRWLGEHRVRWEDSIQVNLKGTG
jgi:hypothetical protein